MRVLVTGACGFIGLNVVEALLARGDTVVGLDRNPPPQGFAPFPVVAGDVRDAALLKTIFREERPDAAIHAAALTPGRASERQRMAAAVEVNIAGTINVLDAAAQARCERVLFLSSAAVYGASAHGKTPLDEAGTLPSPVSLYAVTKLAAERLALRYREIASLDLVAARLGAAFGPWEADTGVRDTLSPHFQLVQLARRQREAVLPRESRLDWNYVRDAARAVAHLLASPSQETVVNIGPGFAFDLGNFCEALRRRHRGFSWRLGSAADANVDLHGSRDRAPLDTRRLRESGFAARFDEAAAYEDYLSWLGKP